MLCRLLLVAVFTLLLTSCATVRSYSYQGIDNLVINSSTDDHIDTAIDIYDARNPCQLKYQGSIQVTPISMTTGLAVDVNHYLVINFSSSSMWTGDRNIGVQSVLRPEQGFSYQYDLSYKDSIYNVELREINTRTGKSRIRESDVLESCQ